MPIELLQQRARALVIGKSPVEVPPFGIAAAATHAQGILVTYDFDPTEYLDPTLEIEAKVYKRVGRNWEFVVGCKWRGGENIDDKTGQRVVPNYWFSLGALRGHQIKIEVTGADGKQLGYKVERTT